MSTREAVIGSHTAPVEEVIANGVNGELVDFFDTDALSERIRAALQDPAAGTGIRQAARRLIL